MKKIILISIIPLIILLVILLLNHAYFEFYYRYSFKNKTIKLSDRHIILVLGAGVSGNRPSYILEDRLKTAATLFEELSQKAKSKTIKIFLSGAPNEVPVMKNYLLSLGLSESILIEDPAGLRTAASCKNLAQLKKQFKHFHLVTQEYHLPRAILICQSKGLDIYSKASDLRNYRNMTWYRAREILAQLYSWKDIL